jgi:hypothetical protein
MEAAALRKMSDAELAEALKAVPGNRDLPRRPVPQLPLLTNHKGSVQERLADVQKYINCLEYNHTGVSYVRKRRDRGAAHVMITAKELIRESLPIQCVEAVFIALYLTHDMHDVLTTYPLSFKSQVNGQVYRHIVLAVTTGNKQWGALGISRCDTLQYKPLTYSSLAALVSDYKASYEDVCHELQKVYVGLPFGKDAHSSSAPVKWRALTLSMKSSWAEVAEALNELAKSGRGALEVYRRSGKLPDEVRSGGSGLGSKEEDSDGSEDEARASTATALQTQTSKPSRAFGV